MQTNIEEKKLASGGKPYTDEFRRSVVTHWLESGKSARKVADEFGIRQWNLRDWRLKFGPAARKPEDPQPETADGLRAENARLRRELARVTSQREILKKLPCLLAAAPREMKITLVAGQAAGGRESGIVLVPRVR